ncbi:MAG: NnrU protein, partial [Alphaproteobacteria bacterium]|nr:NnrU protein [Alphaproteobacteria bacterium]
MRTPLAAALGEPAFAGLYSVLAVAAFVWMLTSYGKAPHVTLA